MSKRRMLVTGVAGALLTFVLDSFSILPEAIVVVGLLWCGWQLLRTSENLPQRQQSSPDAVAWRLPDPSAPRPWPPWISHRSHSSEEPP